LCPHKRFCGLTLDELRTIIRPALKAREEIEELENRIRSAFAKRDEADAAASSALRRMVHGVLADPEEGEDGVLYEALGYVPKRKRRCGLMRKKKGGA
jgi:hypothetical protein